MKTLRHLICWLCTVSASVHSVEAASPSATPTALVILNTTTGPNEFSPVLEYARVDFESAIALKVITPEGRTVSLPRDQISLIFHYPDPTATLSGETDAKALSAKRAEAVALAGRFPKAKAALDRVVADIDSSLRMLAAGQARYGGVWQSPASPSFKDASSRDDLPVLLYKGATYRHLVITRLENGLIGLTHEGGVLKIPVADAPPDLLRVLHTKALTDSKPASGHAGAVPSGRQPAHAATTKLTFTPGEGPRQGEPGWKCTPEEKQAWEAACKEVWSTDDPPAVWTWMKTQLGGIKREQDEPVLPNPVPSYADTLAFINSKIAPYELGYSSLNDCVVVRHQKPGQSSEVQAAFKPEELNAVVRLKIQGTHPGVLLETRTGEKLIALFFHPSSHGGDTVWHDPVNRMSIPVAYGDDLDRVGKALHNLLVMLGARNASF